MNINKSHLQNNFYMSIDVHILFKAKHVFHVRRAMLKLCLKLVEFTNTFSYKKAISNT